MRRKRKRKKWLILLGLALLAAIAGIVVHVSRPDRTVVQTARAERVEKLRSFVSASGEIRAKEFVDIQAEVPGIIVELPVKEGQHVEVGDILLKIDEREYEANVQAGKATHEAAIAEAKRFEVGIETAKIEAARAKVLLEAGKGELVQAEANRDRAKASHARAEKLHAGGLLPTEDYEVAQTALLVTESQVSTARARFEQQEAQVRAAEAAIDQAIASHNAAERRVDVAKANLYHAEEQLRKTTIRSPLSGIITKLNVEKGERAVPGILSNPQATLMTIADMSVVEAQIEVSEVDIITVAMGDPAEVTVDALEDQKLSGQVTEIGQSPISSGGFGSDFSSQEAKDFRVKITLTEPPSVLRPGLSASADITTDVKENLLVIPIQALTMREVAVDENGEYVPPPAEGREVPSANQTRKEKKKELKGVFLRSEGNVARFRPVETGITGETEVEILKGLAIDDEVIIGPYKVLRTIGDGDLVQVDNTLLEGIRQERKRSG